MERPQGYGIRCPWCKEWVTPADTDKPCAKSLLADGKHPVVVIDTSKNPWDAVAEDVKKRLQGGA